MTCVVAYPNVGSVCAAGMRKGCVGCHQQESPKYSIAFVGRASGCSPIRFSPLQVVELQEAHIQIDVLKSKLEMPPMSVVAHRFPICLFSSLRHVQVQYSLTSIRGVGRRFSNLICKKAEVDPNKR